MWSTLVVSLLLHLGLSEAIGHSKFKHWYPDYGSVLDALLEGNCYTQICDPSVNCSAQLAAYEATTERVIAIDRCYNGMIAYFHARYTAHMLS